MSTAIKGLILFVNDHRVIASQVVFVLVFCLGFYLGGIDTSDIN